MTVVQNDQKNYGMKRIWYEMTMVRNYESIVVRNEYGTYCFRVFVVVVLFFVLFVFLVFLLFVVVCLFVVVVVCFGVFYWGFLLLFFCSSDS